MQVFFHYRVAASVLFFWAGVGCSRSQQGYFERGNSLYGAGNYAEAAINYRNAIKKTPQSAEAHQKLGLAEYSLGDVENAMGELSQAHRLAPSNLSILENLADVSFNRYLSSGRTQALYDFVNGMVKEILAKNANSAIGLRLQASLYYGDGKIKDAIATYEKADKVDPFDPDVLLPLADALSIDGQPAAAERLALDLANHNTGYFPVYDWLSRFYLASGRATEAEKVLKTRIDRSPNEFSAVLSLAAFYRNLGRAGEAKELLDTSAARATNIPDRYAQTGNFYVSAKEYVSAEQAFRSGITAQPSAKGDYLTRLASVHLLQKRPAEATKDLEEAIKIDPDNWSAQALRISILVDSQNAEQVDQGIALAKGFAAKRPSDGRFPALLARAFSWKGDSALAASYYQSAARLDRQFREPRLALAEISRNKRDYTGVFRYTEEVLAIAPDDLQARLLHIWGWVGQGLYAEADSEMQGMLKEFPDSDDVKLQAGLLYITETKSRAAISLFEKLLRTFPGDQRILAGMATAYVQMGSPDAAIRLVSDEVQKNPSSVEKRLLLANLAEKLKRFDLALQNFQVLAQQHPDVSEYQFEIGKLYEYAGDKKKTVESFEAARRLAPQDATKEGRLAAAYEAAGLMEQADAAYAHSLQLNPADPALLNNRAYFLADTGKNPKEALRLAQSALSKMPNDPSVLDTLAFTYIKLNQNDNATSILNRLAHDYPNQPMFRYHLAMALVQNGDKDRAVKELEEGLSKGPSKEDQAKMKGLLSKLG